MNAWQYLLKKGAGATALAILFSNITATDTWDALLKKSSAPDGSTAWVHLISALEATEVPTVSGGQYSRREGDRDLLLAQAMREDEEIMIVIRKFLQELG